MQVSERGEIERLEAEPGMAAVIRGDLDALKRWFEHDAAQKPLEYHQQYCLCVRWRSSACEDEQPAWCMTQAYKNMAMLKGHGGIFLYLVEQRGLHLGATCAPMMEAIDGHPGLARSLWEIDPGSVNTFYTEDLGPQFEGHPGHRILWPILEALDHRRFDYATALWELGADVNAHFPLVTIADSRHIWKEEWLFATRWALEWGARVNGSGLLRRAARLAKWSLVEYLLDHGADVNDLGIDEAGSPCITHSGQHRRKRFCETSALRQAVEGEYTSRWKPRPGRPSEYDSDDTEDSWMESDDWIVGFHDHKEYHSRKKILALFLRHGADPDRPDEDGKTPLNAAIEIGLHEFVDLMEVKSQRQQRTKRDSFIDLPAAIHRDIGTGAEDQRERRLSFFSLPREVRDHIYLYALTPEDREVYQLHNTDIRIDQPMRHAVRPVSGNAWFSSTFQQRMALLRSNKSIHAEASDTLHAHFNFSLPPWTTPDYLVFLRTWLGTPHRSRIASIKLSKDLQMVPLPETQPTRPHEPKLAYRGSLIPIYKDAVPFPEDFQLLLDDLPNLRHVQLSLFFALDEGYTGRLDMFRAEADVPKILNGVKALTGPFLERGVKVDLRVYDEEGSERSNVVREIAKMIARGVSIDDITVERLMALRKKAKWSPFGFRGRYE